MPRCFFALPVPAAAASTLAAFSADLAGGALARWRPRSLRADDMHLTLRFLGVVADDQIARLTEGMHALAADSPPLACRTAGLALWPDLRRPHVLVTGVRSEGPLDDLAAAFEQLACSLGFAPERRRFRPHLTLARFRSGTRPVTGALPTAPAVTFSFTHVELWESLPRPGEKRYRALSASALSASSSGSR
jgi:2'-5' RNA ligase